ncbi:MAG: hypothetical protein HZB76_02235, partial [Chlamydiae bacterium]|nr:hypothetical protein [Chlamydiota bacterium]
LAVYYTNLSVFNLTCLALYDASSQYDPDASYTSSVAISYINRNVKGNRLKRNPYGIIEVQPFTLCEVAGRELAPFIDTGSSAGSAISNGLCKIAEYAKSKLGYQSSTHAPKAQIPPFSPSKVLSIIKKLKPVDDNDMLSLEINGRHVIFIGTTHDREYYNFASDLTNYATDKKLAYFTEGLIRNEKAEKKEVVDLLDKTSKGYFFGLENPEIKSICEFAFRSLMMSNEKITLEREVCFYTIFSSLKNREILHRLAKKTNLHLIKELDKLVSRHATEALSQINRVELLTEELPKLRSFNNISQWIKLCNQLTLALLRKSAIDSKLKDIIKKALKNPNDTELSKKYLDEVDLKLRNQSFLDTILKTLPTLPADVTAVVCIGNSHMPGIREALEKESS